GDGQFNFPYGVATDGSGNVYVADDGNHRIQKFDASGTFLTAWGSDGSGNGQFHYRQGAPTDGSGNVHVAATTNHRIPTSSSPRPHEKGLWTEWCPQGLGFLRAPQ